MASKTGPVSSLLGSPQVLSSDDRVKKQMLERNKIQGFVPQIIHLFFLFFLFFSFSVSVFPHVFLPLYLSSFIQYMPLDVFMCYCYWA